jgi:hypothetical protein
LLALFIAYRAEKTESASDTHANIGVVLPEPAIVMDTIVTRRKAIVAYHGLKIRSFSPITRIIMITPSVIFTSLNTLPFVLSKADAIVPSTNMDRRTRDTAI